MIRVVRSQPAPAVLTDKGPSAVKRHGKQVAKGKPAAIDNTIYGHKTVKKLLVKMQHEKCAYCESKVTHVDAGDVEHYRPKGRSKQVDGTVLLVRGYWWLAYTWDNLLFACAKCNQSGKRDLFPLGDKANLCLQPADSLAKEAPLFIDPSADDPEPQMMWRRGVPIGLTPAARTTITELGLRRRPLEKRRDEYYDTIKQLRKNHLALEAKGDPADEELLAENCAKLAAFERATAEYAGMIRAAVRKDFQ